MQCSSLHSENREWKIKHGPVSSVGWPVTLGDKSRIFRLRFSGSTPIYRPIITALTLKEHHLSFSNFKFWHIAPPPNKVRAQIK